MIRGVLSANFYDVAEQVRPLLERIARHDKDGATALDYERDILDRKLQLWVMGDFEAIAITKVTNEAVRLVWVVGKNRHHWQDELDDELRDWGRALGKKRLLVLARPGWAKLAKKRGFREIQRGYEAKL